MVFFHSLTTGHKQSNGQLTAVEHFDVRVFFVHTFFKFVFVEHSSGNLKLLGA